MLGFRHLQRRQSRRGGAPARVKRVAPRPCAMRDLLEPLIILLVDVTV